jgi:spore coat polysaccharide biosynthesis predicted glycosyltransferase SpsG
MYIDDYGRLEYPCGVIVNFSPDAKKFYDKNSTCHKYLLGVDFIPIREIFFKKSSCQKETIFIMMGGSDVMNLTPKIVKTLKDIELEIVAVVNSKKALLEIEDISNVTILYKPSDAKLIHEMKRAKIAITTASMSLYEFSFLGVPTVVIATSFNQIKGLSSLIEHRLAIDYIDIENSSWIKNMEDFVKRYYFQSSLFEKKIDGLGAKRVVEKILELIE